MDSPTKDCSVLIIGIESFTGKYVSAELKKNGYTVLGTSYNRIEGIQQLDVSDKEQVTEFFKNVSPDYIVHLAAVTQVQGNKPVDYYSINTIATQNILDALVDNNIKPRKIIIPSTSNVYGNVNGDKIDEKSPLEPVSHYAISKLAMEKIVQTYFDKLDIIVSRPFNYTGIGQANSFLVPKIVEHFKCRKNEIFLGNIEISRDFSDVRDISKAYRILLESGCKSEFFNICSGRAVKISEIIGYLTEISKHEMNISVKKEYIRTNEITRLQGDNTKIGKLGYSPEYRLSDTVKWMYDCYP